MRLLLDTHLLVWAAAPGLRPAAMPAAAAELIESPENDLLFSALSIWEVAIKTGLGRASFQVDPHLLRRGLLNNGYTELPITGEHGAAVAGLPPIHKDPFDRLLIAQATCEGVPLITSDATVAAYGGVVRRV